MKTGDDLGVPPFMETTTCEEKRDFPVCSVGSYSLYTYPMVWFHTLW